MIQVVGRLLTITMLCTETPNATAIPPHVSPSRTGESKGASGVSGGIEVDVDNSVPVGVMVPVSDGVSSSVGSVSCPPMPACRLKYTAAAPISKMTKSAPSAAGRPSVIYGIRLAWIVSSAFFDLRAVFTDRSAPHTSQLVAFSLSRVPQVRHTLLFCEEGSSSIRAEIIPLNPFAAFYLGSS